MSKMVINWEFVGRERELEQLASTLGRPKPSIAVVYGRRRIGKSALVSQVLKGTQSWQFEGLENQPTKVQMANFCLQLSRQAQMETVPTTPRTWRETFLLLEPYLQANPGCIVLDEFQWMANYRSAPVSDLKMVWDQVFSKIPGVSLVLLGSIASFMLSKVVRSSALYGRTDRVIHLREFKLKDSAKMLPRFGTDELLDAQMILGGVPKYQELAKEYPSLYMAIEDLAFTENGYLLEEHNRIFVSHFGRNDEYRRIIAALASRPYGMYRLELADAASIDTGGGLTRHLGDLESAGFIKSVRPIGKPSKTRIIKYVLSDAYLRFYYSMILPNLGAISEGHPPIKFAALIHKPAFHNWRGRAFELMCMQHADRLAAILGFHGIEYNSGPYFRSSSVQNKGVQIDLVFDRADNVLLLCEMKCRQQPLRKSTVDEMKKKAEYMRALFPTKTIQSVLVHHGPITDAVRHSPHILRTVDSRLLIE